MKQFVSNLSIGSEQTYTSRCHCWLPSWEILLGEPIENCKTNKLFLKKLDQQHGQLYGVLN